MRTALPCNEFVIGRQNRHRTKGGSKKCGSNPNELLPLILKGGGVAATLCVVLLTVVAALVLFHNHHFAAHNVCAAFECVLHLAGADLLGHQFARQCEHVNRSVGGAVDCGIVDASGD